MKFYSLTNCPVDRPEFEAKVNGRPWLITAMVFGIIGGFLGWYLHRYFYPIRLSHNGWQALVMAVIVLGFISIFFLLGLMFFVSWRQTLSKDNWVVRAHAGRIYIRLRRFDDKLSQRADTQIVEIERSEIRSIRPIRLGFSFTGIEPGTKTWDRWRGFDIQIESHDSARLSDLMETERQRLTTLHKSGRPLEQPVQWIGRAIRVPWTGFGFRLSPSYEAGKAYFQSWRCLVEEVKQSLDFDLIQMRSLSREDQIAKLRELAGYQPLQAVVIARMLLNISGQEAKELIFSPAQQPSSGSLQENHT